MASLGNDKKYFVKFTINMILMHIHTYVQIISNNSGCVLLVDSWVEYTLSHVILQLMIVYIVGANIKWELLPIISGQWDTHTNKIYSEKMNCKGIKWQYVTTQLTVVTDI